MVASMKDTGIMENNKAKAFTDKIMDSQDGVNGKTVKEFAGWIMNYDSFI